MKVAEKVVPELRFHGFAGSWELKKSNVLFSNSRKKRGDVSLTIFSYSVKIWLDYRKKLFKRHNVAPCFLLLQQSVSASDPF